MFFRALRSVIQPVSRTILSSQSLFKSFPHLHGCHLLSIRPFSGNVPAANVVFHGAGLRGIPAGTVRGRDVKNRTKQQHLAFVMSERNKDKAKVEKANTREREKCVKRFESGKKKQKEKRNERGAAAKWMRRCGWKRLQVLRVFGELKAELKAAGMTFKDLENLKATGVTWQSWMRERLMKKRIQSQSTHIQKDEQSQSAASRRQTKSCTRGRGQG